MARSVINERGRGMRNLARSVVGGSLMACAVIAQAGNSGYLFCEAEYRSYDDDRFEVYISNVFRVSSVYDSEVSDSYGDFIESRYSPAGTIYDVTCEYYLEDTRRDAEDERSDVIANWGGRDFDVHRVRWSY